MKIRNATLKDFPKGKLVTLKKDLIVYKKVRGAIVELIIPEGAKAVRARHNKNNKIRSNVAIVSAIFPFDYDNHFGLFYKELPMIERSFYNFIFGNAQPMSYFIGKVVKPLKGFDTSTFDPCRSGIHFFATRKEAEKY